MLRKTLIIIRELIVTCGMYFFGSWIYVLNNHHLRREHRLLLSRRFIAYYLSIRIHDLWFEMMVRTSYSGDLSYEQDVCDREGRYCYVRNNNYIIYTRVRSQGVY